MLLTGRLLLRVVNTVRCSGLVGRTRFFVGILHVLSSCQGEDKKRCWPRYKKKLINKLLVSQHKKMLVKSWSRPDMDRLDVHVLKTKNIEHKNFTQSVGQPI